MKDEKRRWNDNWDGELTDEEQGNQKKKKKSLALGTEFKNFRIRYK